MQNDSLVSKSNAILLSLYSQVHAWVESHQSTLSVFPTTVTRWCCCCQPSWSTGICHWHHRYQTFSLICVAIRVINLLASHLKLTAWIYSIWTLHISLRKYIKILMPADWRVTSERIVLFCVRSKAWYITRYYSFGSLAYAINGLLLKSPIHFLTLLHLGSQRAWHFTIKLFRTIKKKKANLSLADK